MSSSQIEAAKFYLEELSKKWRRDLSGKERVRIIQLKLYLKAKQEKSYKFYVLYDKVFLPYILEESWLRVRRNGNSPGVDGVSFKMIENAGVEKFLSELREDLRTQRYRPLPVKRVEIDKEGGGKRPLGIPTIRDRVAQMACKLVLEPIFEADFVDESFGFRPKRSASGAIKKIRKEVRKGNHEVYDADLSKYFDTIPHEKLMIALNERVADKRILNLIKKWLKSPISEDGKIKGGKKVKVGTPQGGVISPLLSNIYLNLLDRIIVNPNSLFAKQGIKIIRYADDFVLLGRKLDDTVIKGLTDLLDRMGLRLNEEKSHLLDVEQSSFDFLGFRFSYKQSMYSSGKYLDISPSPKSRRKVRQNLKAKLKKIGHYKAELVVKELNPILSGWLNYFNIPKVSYLKHAKGELRYYLLDRLVRYYNRKSQRKSRLHRGRAYERLTKHYHLIDPLTYRLTPS